PRIAFVNKCDRPGASPLGVIQQLRTRLGLRAATLQLPLLEEDRFVGIIDLIDEVAVRFTGDQGSVPITSPIPESLRAQATAARAALLDEISLFSDPLTERLIEEQPVDRDLIIAAIRSGVVSGGFVPVLMGSAYHNLGVQPLLDAAVRYLPAPTDRELVVTDEDEQPCVLSGAPSDPVVGFVFKTQETRHGNVSWLRLYQGTLKKGEKLMITRSQQTIRVGRLGRLFAAQLDELPAAASGDIVALFGAPCASGDTLCAGQRVFVSGMHIPDPVVEVSVSLVSGRPEQLSAGLRRFTREDPTLKVYTDPESQELRLRGMGELHLDIVAERLSDEHDCVVSLGAPQVALRQTIRQRADFDHLLRRQSGGPGMYARVVGHIEPIEEEEIMFEWNVIGGAIPQEYRESVRRGGLAALSSGMDLPAVGVRLTITDGDTHSVDSSERAFEAAAREAVLLAFAATAPVVLEPVMRVSAEAEADHQGALLRSILTRRGQIRDAVVRLGTSAVEADVPLSEMFGYAGALRSVTGGVGGFSMAFSHYAPRQS
ncbi:MAG: elongation factor G, partial [Myxococcota bacterium]